MATSGLSSLPISFPLSPAAINDARLARIARLDICQPKIRTIKYQTINVADNDSISEVYSVNYLGSLGILYTHKCNDFHLILKFWEIHFHVIIFRIFIFVISMIQWILDILILRLFIWILVKPIFRFRFIIFMVIYYGLVKIDIIWIKEISDGSTILPRAIL